MAKRKPHNNSFVIDHPHLMEEWDNEENDISPQHVYANSKQSVWWKCVKSHSWEAKVYRKTICPYCARRKVSVDNCLIITHPELAEEWHPSKNIFSATQFTSSSSQRVWWQCSKNTEHVWEAKIRNRVAGLGCLYCAGKLVSSAESLAYVYPSTAAEWHPIKNGTLTPEQVRFGSAKSVWWKCDKGHEWRGSIGNRGSRQGRCPYCSNQKVGIDNCLATTHPELAKEWHPAKNIDLTPYDIVAGSNKIIWWQCSKDHEWQAPSARRAGGIGCSRCSGRKATPENNLTTTHPELAKEWDLTKNTFGPDKIVAGSGKKVWWQCTINKSHGWEAKIAERVGNDKRKGTNCPHCYSQISDAEYRLFSELKLIFLDIKQKKLIKGKEADIFIEDLKLVIEVDGGHFHKSEKRIKNDKEKNQFFETLGYCVQRLRGKNLLHLSKHDLEFNCGNIKITDIKSLLNKIRERRAAYIDSDTEERISNYLKIKTYWNEEEYLRIRKALPGKFTLGNFNEKRPELAEEWHPTKNGQSLSEDYSLKSGKLVWWQCSKNKEHEWQSRIACRANGGGCPYCSNKKVCKDNCLATVNPELAAEWHPSRNAPLTPKDVVANSNKKIWWRCLHNPEHEWKTSVDIRHRENTGCPCCSGKKVHMSNCLATINPKLTAEWHLTENEGLSPQEVTTGSKKLIWWQCRKDKTHEWVASIDSRNRGNGCPFCSGQKIHLSNCLATANPILAAEWHPSKNGELTPYDFTRGSKKLKIWWLCPLGHEYQALILTRSHGHGCPECARKIKKETALKRWERYRKMKAEEKTNILERATES